jgi:hypothetical protein
MEDFLSIIIEAIIPQNDAHNNNDVMCAMCMATHESLGDNLRKHSCCNHFTCVQCINIWYKKVYYNSYNEKKYKCYICKKLHLPSGYYPQPNTIGMQSDITPEDLDLVALRLRGYSRTPVFDVYNSDFFARYLYNADDEFRWNNYQPYQTTMISNDNYSDYITLRAKISVRGMTTLAEADAILSDGAVAFSGTGQGKTITKLAPFIPFSVDSIAGLAVNDRILFAGGTSPSKHYGIYVITNLGSDSSAWVLTRANDADNASTNGIVTVGIYTFITEGTDRRHQGWALITFAGNIDVNTQTWDTIHEEDDALSIHGPLLPI